MERKKTGSLVINRSDREDKNIIIIDNKIKLTIKEISGKWVKLVFTPLTEEYIHIKRGELE